MTALATDSGRKTPARLAGSAVLACQSDARLVKLVRSGHERAFETIVERYRKPLVRYCRRILPESRCEDAVQQALINAHTALRSSDDEVQLKPWLYAITRNAALNMLRQNGWNYEQIPLDFDGVRRPDQVFEQTVALQQTVAALNELPERQRSALVMREFEGRSYDEIALALGANDGAVRQLLNRARVTLRGAVSLLTPPPLVARAAASMPPSDGRRAAELFAGVGAAGFAKAGATALVAGSLVVGAVKAPLPLTDNPKPAREKATLTAPTAALDEAVSARDTPIALHPNTAAAHSNGRGAQAPAPAKNRSNSGRSGPSHERETEHSRSREDTRERSGGSDDSGTRERSGSDDSPMSGSGDHSGTSGGSGSDDAVTALGGTDDSTLTSGTSGEGTSGTSGSGESTSGSSGSGAGDATTTTTTSGTSGTSGSDGSSTSGSGSSGSSDTLEH